MKTTQTKSATMNVWRARCRSCRCRQALHYSTIAFMTGFLRLKGKPIKFLKFAAPQTARSHGGTSSSGPAAWIKSTRTRFVLADDCQRIANVMNMKDVWKTAFVALFMTMMSLVRILCVARPF